ncbi:MAG: MBOAT family O-acyltransferase [Myxococcota bacterium]
MQFNSADYILFLCLTFFLFWSLRRWRIWRVWMLVLASCFFYMSWNWYLIILILLSSVIDYMAGAAIARSADPNHRYRWLLVSLISNLGMLFVFKYADFFIRSTNEASAWLGYPLSWPLLNLILPVGISFYTFQTLSYTIDVYRGTLKPAENFREFFLFVIFFPQLVAGPIVRAVDLLPQLGPEPVPDPRQGLEGLARIATGLIKKVAFADLLAVNLVDRVFERPELYSGVECLAAVYAYAFQIYFDFSAYSDIAIGSALLFGYRMPENFNAPYMARNLQDFWHRWHMTLSTWLRDYLYIPLGGSRGSAWQTYRNLMITMLLGGLWHGASWTFVVWGLLHGGGLALTRMWQRTYGSQPGASWQQLLGIFLTFHYVCLAWIFFRAPDFTVAASLLSQLATLTTDSANLVPWVEGLLLLSYVLHAVPARWELRTHQLFIELPAPLRAAILVFLAVVLKQLASVEAVPFIYFQF